MLSVLVAADAAACSPAEEPVVDAPASVKVAVEPAAVHSLRGAFEAGGVVTARTSADIASRIVVPVVAVHVAAGDRVRAGQPLVVLDGRDLEARRARANSSVTALERAAVGVFADRDAAESAAVLARATHGRIAALHERRSATTQELDEAAAAVRSAEARVTAADARLSELAAAIESARAAAAEAEVAAGFAAISAPFDGVITERLVDPGNLAAVGVPLLRIDDTRAFRVEVRVDESRASGIAPGDSVEVLLGTAGAEEASAAALEGRVGEIARTVDATSHTFLVKIDVPTRPGLRSGLFARARFAAGAREALMIPVAAIVPQGQLSTLFVVTPEGRARMRVVRTGARAGTRIEIVAGLVAGGPVVTAPPPGLRDGDPVDATTAGQAGAR
ncbi:MAG: efflux RND transporter periplasmic adaptor subunit [Acidobacteria bacterium]|nr:efflux RND transporter periplasmic adaptor subunit [Acidobacteriota bacterium]